MSTVTISKNAEAALQIAQWIRNGKAPVAELQNRLATMAGFWANVREKCIFRSRGRLLATGGASAIPDSLATRTRWRFAFHTGPYASFAYARFEIAPQNNGAATDPYCTLGVRNPEGSLVGTATMHGGSSGGSYADVPVNMTGGRAHLVDATGAFVFLDEDTEYTGVFSDVGYARLQSASVWEVALVPTTANGYVANNHPAGGPIFDDDREDVTAMARLLHKRSGAPIFHWCSDLDSESPSQVPGENEGNASPAISFTLSSTGLLGGAGSLTATLDAFSLSAHGTNAEFDAIVSADSSVAHGVSLEFVVTLSAANVAQTNGSVNVYVTREFEVDSAPTTLALDGWSESGWVFDGDRTYVNNLHRTSIPVGEYTAGFQITPTFRSSGDITIATNIDAPETTEATGDGNEIVVDVT